MARCEECLHYKPCVDTETRHLKIILLGDKAERCKHFMTTSDVAPKSAWISVDERLPEREGKYLVFTVKGDIKIEPYCTVAINYEPQFNYWVTRWMPLPEPPKGE